MSIELLSEHDYARLCYVRKSADYPAKGTAEWDEWKQLERRAQSAYPSTICRIAWHEAGHILVGHHLGGEAIKITMKQAHMNNTRYPTVTHEVEDTIKVAGHVAEELVLGQADPSDGEASRIARLFRKRRMKESGVTVTPQECFAYVEFAEARAREIATAYRNALNQIAQLAQGPFPVEREALLVALKDVPNGDPLT